MGQLSLAIFDEEMYSDHSMRRWGGSLRKNDCGFQRAK